MSAITGNGGRRRQQLERSPFDQMLLTLPSWSRPRQEGSQKGGNVKEDAAQKVRRSSTYFLPTTEMDCSDLSWRWSTHRRSAVPCSDSAIAGNDKALPGSDLVTAAGQMRTPPSPWSPLSLFSDDMTNTSPGFYSKGSSSVSRDMRSRHWTPTFSQQVAYSASKYHQQEHKQSAPLLARSAHFRVDYDVTNECLIVDWDCDEKFIRNFQPRADETLWVELALTPGKRSRKVVLQKRGVRSFRHQVRFPGLGPGSVEQTTLKLKVATYRSTGRGWCRQYITLKHSVGLRFLPQQVVMRM